MKEARKAEDFVSLFPFQLKKFFENAMTMGLELTFVGGAVRDFILNGNLSPDLDVEARKVSSDWPAELTRILEDLAEINGVQVEILNFGVHRFKLGEFEVEISSPRLEHYDMKGTSSVGHSDFDVKMLGQMEFADSFSRRDFTINAIGVHWNASGEVEYVDPFAGIKDLEKRVLRAIDGNFYFDPVRFLRLVRFSLALDFKIDREMIPNLGMFDLEQVTAHYIKKEALKIGFFPFMKSFFEIIETHDIKIPEELFVLNFCGDDIFDGVKVDSVLEAYIEVEKKGELITPQNKDDFISFFTLRAKNGKRLGQFVEGLYNQSEGIEDYIKNIPTMNLDDFLNNSKTEILNSLCLGLDLFLSLNLPKNLLSEKADLVKALGERNMKNSKFLDHIKNNEVDDSKRSMIKLFFSFNS